MHRCSLIFLLLIAVNATAKPRARDLGIPFEGTPAKWNAITDVPGIEVGQITLIRGASKKGIISQTARTGVTAILPQGKKSSKVPAAWFALNGNGDVTGTHWLDESGFLEGPILTTNTYSVGVVRDAVVEWYAKKNPLPEAGILPVVGETDDSWLNDLYGFHITKKDVFESIDKAKSGPVDEGNVGGGTGNVSFRFKAGIGTSSRKVGSYTIGILVQSNFGARKELLVAGVPIGSEITDLMPIQNAVPKKRDGSIVATLATDAPLLPHQLKRLAKRMGLGMARTGGTAHDSSGDLFIAFSTKSPQKNQKGLLAWENLSNEALDPFFEAAVYATEEAIVNALVAAETLDGINGDKIFALPKDRLLAILKRHGRLKLITSNLVRPQYNPRQIHNGSPSRLPASRSVKYLPTRRP